MNGSRKMLSVGALVAFLLCGAPSGRAPAPQAAQPSPLNAATHISAKAAATQASPKAAVQASAAPCAPLLDVLAACAAHPRCEPDMPMFLSGAARSSLVAVEGLPGFSDETFDRYCLPSCQTRTTKVDERSLARDVYAVGTRDIVKSEVSVGTMVDGVALNEKPHVGEQGVPLAENEQSLGAPGRETITSFECDSAFELATSDC